MSIRSGSGWIRGCSIGCALGIVILTLPARPIVAGTEAAAGTLAWVGCWRLVAVDEEAVPQSADGSQRICLESGDTPSSLSRAIVEDEAVAQEMLIANGSRRPVSKGGCSGWKRSLLSGDRQRLYLQSEITCEGGDKNSFSGASLIVSGGQWVDINVARIDGERELVVHHYRSVDADTAALPGTIPAAWRTARVAAAAGRDASGHSHQRLHGPARRREGFIRRRALHRLHPLPPHRCRVEEALRLARGWLAALRVHERVRRIEEGRPILEFAKNKNPARARVSE